MAVRVSPPGAVKIIVKIRKWYMETKNKIKDFNKKTCQCVKAAKNTCKRKCLAILPNFKRGNRKYLEFWGYL